MSYKHNRFFAVLAVMLLMCCSFLPSGFAASSTEGTLGIAGVGSFSLPEWMAATEAKGLENQPNAGLQYDLVGLFGDSWHYARLVSYRIEQNLGPASLLFGVAEANPQILGELARPLLEKSLAENGGKILEWSQARKTPFGGRSVPSISARLIMTEKVPLPMSAKVYIFMHKEKVFALGIFAPDTDRFFWEKSINDMTGKMKWEL